MLVYVHVRMHERRGSKRRWDSRQPASSRLPHWYEHCWPLQHALSPRVRRFSRASTAAPSTNRSQLQSTRSRTPHRVCPRSPGKARPPRRLESSRARFRRPLPYSTADWLANDGCTAHASTSWATTAVCNHIRRLRTDPSSWRIKRKKIEFLKL